MKLNCVSRATGIIAASGVLSLTFFAAMANAQSKSQKPSPKTTSTPRTADEHPDLNGIWNRATAAGNGGFYLVKNGNQVQYLQRNPLVLDNDPDLTKSRALRQITNQETREESYKENPNLMPPYKPELMAKVHDLDLHENEVDPSFHCHPAGVPRMGPPRQIVEAPGVIVFLYMSENGAPYRVIPTDGRSHRTDVEPSYSGDSVGHWEGDTLVVDVNNFNTDTWLGTDGWFHSSKMHVVERLTRVGTRIHYEVTVEDPEAFTKPWAMKPVDLDLSIDPADFVSDATSIEAPCVEVDSSHIVNHDHL